jgi:hypothetical protein
MVAVREIDGTARERAETGGKLGSPVDREVGREQLWLREMGLVGPPERWNWIVEGVWVATSPEGEG